MSEKNQNAQNRPKPSQKKTSSATVVLNRFLGVLLAMVIVAVTGVVVYALRIGVDVPSHTSGTVVTDPNAPPTEAFVPTTTTEEETEPEEDPVERLALDHLAEMTLDEKLAQLILTSPDSLTDSYYRTYAGDRAAERLEQYPVAGLIFESGNVSDAEQVKQTVSEWQSYSKLPLFIGAAEEGGAESLLSGVGLMTPTESMLTYGTAGDTDAVRALGKTMGEELYAAGFNLNLAPVADVTSEANAGTALAERSFGASPLTVSKMAAAMVRGLQEGGEIACLKHFPGVGSMQEGYYSDTLSRTLDELRENDWLPFKNGIAAGAGMVMVSHVSMPELLGSDVPCDLSETVVTEYLRGELGYDGVVVTEDLDSIPNAYSANASVQALLAGCDLIYTTDSVGDTLAALQQAVADGTLTEERVNESVYRILLLKCRFGIVTE